MPGALNRRSGGLRFPPVSALVYASMGRQTHVSDGSDKPCTFDDFGRRRPESSLPRFLGDHELPARAGAGLGGGDDGAGDIEAEHVIEHGEEQVMLRRMRGLVAGQRGEIATERGRIRLSQGPAQAPP